MKDGASLGAVVKVMHVKAISSTPSGRRPQSEDCISVDLPALTCSINFYAIVQPSTILERPQVSRHGSKSVGL